MERNLITNRVNILKSKFLYEVKWQNWPSEYNSFEPLHHLTNVKNHVIKFEQENNTVEQELKEIESILNKTETIDKCNLTVTEFIDNEIENISYLNPFYVIGNLKEDIPFQIVRMEQWEHGEIMAEIEWTLRRNGIKPKNSFLSRELLKGKYRQLLIEFYENKIKFLK